MPIEETNLGLTNFTNTFVLNCTFTGDKPLHLVNFNWKTNMTNFTKQEIKIGTNSFYLPSEWFDSQQKINRLKHIIETAKYNYDCIGWKTSKNKKPTTIGTLIKDFFNHKVQVDKIIDLFMESHLEFGLSLNKFCDMTGISDTTLRWYVDRRNKKINAENAEKIKQEELSATISTSKNENSDKIVHNSKRTVKSAVKKSSNNKTTQKCHKVIENSNITCSKEISSGRGDSQFGGGEGTYDFEKFIKTYQHAKDTGNIASDGSIKQQINLTVNAKSKCEKDIVLLIKNDPRMEYSIAFLANFIKSQDKDFNKKAFKETVIQNLVDSKVLKMSKDKKRVWFAFKSKIKEANFAIEIYETIDAE